MLAVRRGPILLRVSSNSSRDQRLMKSLVCETPRQGVAMFTVLAAPCFVDMTTEAVTVGTDSRPATASPCSSEFKWISWRLAVIGKDSLAVDETRKPTPLFYK